MATSLNRMLLADGRRLAWREYGNAAGFPILFFHGNLNSRLFEPAWDKTQAQTLQAGARVIAVDRPGYGESDFLPARTYKSWADDVRQLAVELQLPRFSVLGYSSGGPNAAVCGAELGPSLVASVGLISTDGPYTLMPHLMQSMFGGAEGLALPRAAKRTEHSAADMRASYESMKKPDRRQMALADLDEAVKQGFEGAGQDGVLESHDWGFDLQQVGHGGKLPVLGWHGTADEDVPVEAGQFVAHNVPGIQMNILEGENHTLLRRHWESILRDVVTAAENSPTSRSKM